MVPDLDLTSENAIECIRAAAAAKVKRVRNTRRRVRKRQSRGNTALFGTQLGRLGVGGAEVEVLGGHEQSKWGGDIFMSAR